MRFMRLRIFRCHSVGLDSWFFSLSFRLFFVRILVYSLRYASTNASFTLCAVYSITKLQIAKPKTTSSLNVQRIEIYIYVHAQCLISFYIFVEIVVICYMFLSFSLSLFLFLLANGINVEYEAQTSLFFLFSLSLPLLHSSRCFIALSKWHKW